MSVLTITKDNDYCCSYFAFTIFSMCETTTTATVSLLFKELIQSLIYFFTTKIAQTKKNFI